MNKTVRFTHVVERSGVPEVHTLWLPPGKDPELQRAQKTHRVMTIESTAGGAKADVGIVGFTSDAGPKAQFLIFPKSLKRFEGARIVGVKFDLVAQPKLASIDALKQMATPRRLAGKSSSKFIPSAGSKFTAPELKSETAPADTLRQRDADVVPFPAEKLTTAKRKTSAAKKNQRQLPALTKPRAIDETSEFRAGPRERESTVRGDSTREAALIHAVRSAMKELQQGKSVAAYQRLERAVSAISRSR